MIDNLPVKPISEIIKPLERATVSLIKRYERLRCKLVRHSNHLSFLRKCRNANVTPKFLKINKKFNLERAKKIVKKSEKILLNCFIAETRRQVFSLQRKIVNIQSKIFNEIPHEIFQEIEIFISYVTTKIDKKQKLRHQKKWEKLTEGHQNQRNPEHHNKKVVVNISDTQLTDEQLKVLSRGLNFSESPTQVPTFDIIKSIESSTVKLAPEKLAEFKAQIKKAIEKHKIHNRNLSLEEIEALKKLKENKNIIISKADKGNVTVIQNKNDYEQKMSNLVKSDAYEQLQTDPTKAIEKEVCTVIKKSREFDDVTRRRISPSYSKPPHMYGLIKIHKENYPVRPIVSSIGSPCQALAKYLVPLLNPVIGKSRSYIKNSSDFVNRIKDRTLPPGTILASFDVVNLFTTTPPDAALETLQEKLKVDSTLKDRTNLTVGTIMELVTVCVRKTYFQYGSNFYKPKDGLVMGSSLSPILANVYLEKFEEEAINTFDPKPLQFLRYVDDIYIEWPENIRPIEELQTHFNMKSNVTKFTLEKEKDEGLPFLDVHVKRKNNKITTEVYRKPTDSGLYLQYDSNHPCAVKNGIVSTLLHRAKTHSSDKKKYKEEVQKVKTTLIENKYPPKLIDNIIRKHENEERKEIEKKKPETTITLPYIPRLSEKIRKIGNKANIRIVFSSNNTLRNQLVNFRPKSQKRDKEVIYSIPCECSKNYIGETGRPLEVRLKEHQYSLKKRDPDVSKLCEHHFTTGHRFLWDQAEIIGQEQNWKARKVHEAAEIMKGGDMVISTPSFDIDPVWRHMIKNLKIRKSKEQGNNTTVRRSRRIIEREKQGQQQPATQSRRQHRGRTAAATTNAVT